MAAWLLSSRKGKKQQLPSIILIKQKHNLKFLKIYKNKGI